jgi:hypothetical protein
VRTYVGELLPDALEGRIEPSRVFDRAVDLDGDPDGYRAMNEREVIQVLLGPLATAAAAAIFAHERPSIGRPALNLSRLG